MYLWITFNHVNVHGLKMSSSCHPRHSTTGALTSTRRKKTKNKSIWHLRVLFPVFCGCGLLSKVVSLEDIGNSYFVEIVCKPFELLYS